jgi:hypothetical protein
LLGRVPQEPPAAQPRRRARAELPLPRAQAILQARRADGEAPGSGAERDAAGTLGPDAPDQFHLSGSGTPALASSNVKVISSGNNGALASSPGWLEPRRPWAHLRSCSVRPDCVGQAVRHPRPLVRRSNDRVTFWPTAFVANTRSGVVLESNAVPHANGLPCRTTMS